MTTPHPRIRRGLAAAVATGALLVPLTGLPAGAAPLPAVTAADSPSPSPSGSGVRAMSPEVAKELDARLQEVLRETGTPGVTVGIWTPGQESYVRSFGVADKSDGQPMAPDLYMRIGSETKTFTVTALLQLVDQGKVSLDDPIGKYIDGVPNGNRITLRELAGMRSGLFNYSNDEGFYRALTSDPQHVFSPQRLLDYSFRHPPVFPPGEKFDYSNTNLILLGLLVEQRSGQPLDQYIQRNILDPAGLKHTVFPTNADFPEPHAQGYSRQTADGRDQDTADWNPSWAWAAGAMISTLQDMRVWAGTVASGEFPDGSRMISPALQKERLVTPPTPVKGAGYGLGIFDVRGWIGHNGSLPGYESLTVHLPASGTTLVVLLNTDTDHDGEEPSTLFGRAVTEIVSPDHVFDLPAQPTAH
ncbi:beta-lactamase family protein [Streptomyces sp. J2-1]|uniref:serine hydrolase domain-containing protein n=1 Tax=Streptomyces corallincola TaxID=2851888 RepID=UPI001C382CD2|nr:serine hydrolase domain-containing protein [Streptomyces corallincola]MBV2356237.1 beta-lactamase family protein [Streptomyces corallincola]